MMADEDCRAPKRQRVSRECGNKSADGNSMIRKRSVLGEITNISQDVSRPAKIMGAEKIREVNPNRVSKNSTNPANTELASGGKDAQRLEYGSLIFQHLHSLEVESKNRPLSNYMEKIQTDINPNMRAILIDWLVEVAEEYKFVSDTLYLTVSYIDRFLSVHNVTRNKLQLIGVSCMLIAGKYEEINPPNVQDFCYITDNTYRSDEVVDMEKEVLKLLGYEISNPTIKTFLRIFNKFTEEKELNTNLQHDCLCYYLAELSLTSYDCVRYIPSMVAASVIFLARLTLQPDSYPWTLVLQHDTCYKPYQLKECVHTLHALQAKSETSATAVRQKYIDHKFKSVALLNPPLDIPARFFEVSSE